MKVLFHPEFPGEVRKFAAEYGRISVGLEERFRHEVDEAIKTAPTSAGHLLNTGSAIVEGVRRRNLRAYSVPSLPVVRTRLRGWRDLEHESLPSPPVATPTGKLNCTVGRQFTQPLSANFRSLSKN
jgi:hypothetical protein